MTYTLTHPFAPVTRTRRTGGLGLMSRLLDLLALDRQRQALRDMDANRLADLGLTRSEALAEANRPLWDGPALRR